VKISSFRTFFFIPECGRTRCLWWNRPEFTSVMRFLARGQWCQFRPIYGTRPYGGNRLATHTKAAYRNSQQVLNIYSARYVCYR